MTGESISFFALLCEKVNELDELELELFVELGLKKLFKVLCDLNGFEVFGHALVHVSLS
jgi:hypothetical protein